MTSREVSTPGKARTGKAEFEASVPDAPAAEVVPPTRDDGSRPVKTTRVLKGTVEEQMAALIARQQELEQSQRELQARNADLEQIVRLSPRAAAPQAKELPTVKEAQKLLDKAETAEERRPILTNEGWVVHEKAFEQPNGDLERALKKLAA